MASRSVRPDATRPRRRLHAWVLVAASALALAIPAAPAAAGGISIAVAVEEWCDVEVSTCASAYVNWSGSTQSLRQKVDVVRLGRRSFIPLAWAGGYIGVQKGGNSVSGIVGSTAVFSLGGEGVTVRRLPNGKRNRNCEGGFDGDAGASCRIHLSRAIRAGDRYAYRVTLLASGWQRGEVVLPGGKVLWIADLKPGSAAPFGFTSVYNFMEYFGPPAAAEDMPTSTVVFRRPGARMDFTGASRIEGVCATASYDNLRFGIAMTTFSDGSDC